MKLTEINTAKENDSKYLKECLEKNYEKVVGIPLYVEIRYFKTGLDAWSWKASRMLGEQGVKEMTTIPLDNPELLAMLEWVCRWLDGSFNILITEENLKRWAQGDKEAIEGLSLHILGHIADMDRRDFFTSFREWSGLVGKKEEIIIFGKATDIVLEHMAEKIALEKGSPSLLEKCRRKSSENFEWLRADLKKTKKELRDIKQVEPSTRKEYVLGTSLVSLAYKLAWKKCGYGEIYAQLLDYYNREIGKMYREMGIAGKLKTVVRETKKYNAELEEMLEKADLSDIRAINKALWEFISKDHKNIRAP